MGLRSGGLWALVVITIEVILVLLDLAERVFGIWLLPPLWAKVTIGMGVLIFAQYLVYRDQQKKFNLGAETRKGKEKLAKLAECMKTGRRFLHRPSSRSEADWVKWASDVDDWMSNTFVIIQTEFGDLAVEKYVNDAGMLDGEYPGVPHDFQHRLQVLNRRLQNLDAIAQRIDAYL